VIVHLVLFRLRPGIAHDDDQVKAVVAGMGPLPTQIAAIRGWEHGFNMTPDAQAWDYGLRATFDDEEALHAYFDHPAHQPVVRQWEEISELVFCDFKV
jgi:hypothetical protein